MLLLCSPFWGVGGAWNFEPFQVAVSVIPDYWCPLKKEGYEVWRGLTF